MAFQKSKKLNMLAETKTLDSLEEAADKTCSSGVDDDRTAFELLETGFDLCKAAEGELVWAVTPKDAELIYLFVGSREDVQETIDACDDKDEDDPFDKDDDSNDDGMHESDEDEDKKKNHEDDDDDEEEDEEDEDDDEDEDEPESKEELSILGKDSADDYEEIEDPDAKPEEEEADEIPEEKQALLFCTKTGKWAFRTLQNRGTVAAPNMQWIQKGGFVESKEEAIERAQSLGLVAMEASGD